MGERVRDAFAPVRWDLIGFGLSRAFSVALLAYAAAAVWAPGESLGLRVAMLLCATAAAVAVAVALPCADGRAGRGAVTPWAVAAVGAVGVGLVAWGRFAALTPPALTGFALTGLCAGYFESVWGRRFTGMSGDRIQTYTLLMTAFSAILGIALNVPSRPVFFCCVAALPVGAAALFAWGDSARGRRAEGCVAGPAAGSAATPVASATSAAGPAASAAPAASPAADALRERRLRALINILICCLIYSTIYNMVVVLAYDFMAPGSASQVRFVANLVTALGLLALSLFLHRPLSPVALLRLVLPVTAVGFVLYLVAPQSLGWAALTVSGIGRKLFDILTWVLVAQAVTVHALPPDRFFGFLIAGKNMGYLLGLLLATVSLAYDPGIVQAVTVTPVLLLVLIVLFVWVFPERTVDQLFGVVDAPRPDRTSPAGEGAAEPGIAERAAEVARAHGCTPRESEVLELLARGRTQAVIAARLGISAGTAHTHIVHVYQKLGVSRQQELIELVEKANPANLAGFGEGLEPAEDAVPADVSGRPA